MEWIEEPPPSAGTATAAAGGQRPATRPTGVVADDKQSAPPPALENLPSEEERGEKPMQVRPFLELLQWPHDQRLRLPETVAQHRAKKQREGTACFLASAFAHDP